MSEKTRKPTGPGVLAGFALFALSIIAGLWLGDWRMPASGLVLLLLGAALDGGRKAQ